ncbi:MAG: ABC transporter [Candidatus Magasanikbacteria bacterium CG11_big_fil_rev_8_21_14_0_20_39_34]|uniref:ABC transporter n=1 Tax=Candidatus Magasanikbacteria bacterium CG11_big_fil_rev_8_21_14_0_20_39_34 TaxID=1974653 RepID=A0A2H0N4H6_9BACT|nr:MAG: ABC transporter [Candidatus Magasanikbacteria bacterium CG11_big_fil_rev_8_21_14_0_20_39_34]
MSTLLQINNLNKTYGQRILFEKASLTVVDKQKIAVIGRNGAGKSTLFKMIMGEEEKDSGEILIPDYTRIGYLTQHDLFLPDETVMDFLLRISGKEPWECSKMAGKFQIKNELLEKNIASLAGGYQMRVKLISMLLADPNILLLDEPTNYLDLSTLLLLEDFLHSYRGTFLLISHDREFLRKTCKETLEIEQGKITLYPRPLDEYLEYKEEQIEMAKRFNKKIIKEKQHLQSFVDRFSAKASKASQAQSKAKQIQKLKTIDIAHPMSTTRIQIPRVADKKGIALRVEDLHIGYGDKVVAKDITFEVDRGEHIAILGDNGQGKSTFLKTLTEEIAPLKGNFRFSHDIHIGYYSQHVASMLKGEEQVQKYLERVALSGTKQEEILKMAGNFLFRGDDVLKPISLLSGGEKARLCLAGLLLQKNEVLLLDEPTNHLDFETVESLAVALQNCNVTLLFVSHNRAFVNTVADAIIEVGKGKVLRYRHNFEEYVYHLKKHLHDEEVGEEKNEVVASTPVNERKALQLELRKEKRALQKLEEEMESFRMEKQKILHWFEKHPTEYSREKSERHQELEEFLSEKEILWVQTVERVETIEKNLH